MANRKHTKRSETNNKQIKENNINNEKCNLFLRFTQNISVAGGVSLKGFYNLDVIHNRYHTCNCGKETIVNDTFMINNYDSNKPNNMINNVDYD